MKHINQVYPKKPSPCHCMNIRRAARAVSDFYDTALRPSGLTAAQLSLLINLHALENATISTLAKTMRIDRTTLNRNLKPLLDAGLLVQNIGADSRTRLISLTDSGKATLELGCTLWEECQQDISEYMGESELAQLTKLIGKLESLVP